MLSNVVLHCPHCEKRFFESVPYIQGQIKAMKMDKAREVGIQLHEKRGPFYDKWLEAMEKRGEQMRCKWCKWLHEPFDNPKYMGWPCFGAGHRGGEFACSHFLLRSGD